MMAGTSAIVHGTYIAVQGKKAFRKVALLVGMLATIWHPVMHPVMETWCVHGSVMMTGTLASVQVKDIVVQGRVTFHKVALLVGTLAAIWHPVMLHVMETWCVHGMGTMTGTSAIVMDTTVVQSMVAFRKVAANVGVLATVWHPAMQHVMETWCVHGSVMMAGTWAIVQVQDIVVQAHMRRRQLQNHQHQRLMTMIMKTTKSQMNRPACKINVSTRGLVM
jgi:hypothetical protein